MNDDLLKDFLALPNDKTLAWLEQNKKQLNIEFVAALRAEAEKQAYQGNLEEAQQVLDHAAQVPDVIETPIAMGLVWRGRAHVLQVHGHYNESLNATKQAVAIYQQYSSEEEKGFDIAIARTLEVYTLGEVGRFEEAIELAHQIRSHFLQRDFTRGLAFLAGNLALIYTLAWQPEQALQEYERVYDFFLQTNDKRQAMRALHDMGVAANRLDQLDRARTYYMQALPAFREAGDVVRVIKSYYNLAELSLREGQYEEALAHIAQARQDDLANVESGGYIDRFEAGVRQVLGQNDEARHLLERALSAFDKMKYRVEVGRTLVALGQLLAKEPTTTSEALTYFERAEQSFEALAESAPAFAAFSKLEQGQLYLKMGRISQAVACAEAAYAVFNEMNSPLRCAEAHILLGDCCSEKQPERAKRFYQRALQAVGSQTPTLAYRGWHGLGRLAMAEGKYDDAEHAYKQAVTLLDTVRRALSQHRQQAGFLEDKQALIEELVTVLHQQPKSETRILKWVERFKAGVLAELLMGMSVKNADDDAFQALLAERERLRAKLDHWESQLRGKIDLSEIDLGETFAQQRGSAIRSQEDHNAKRRTQLHRDLDALDEKLARLNRAAYEWHKGAAIEPNAIHELLDEETILLSYYTAEGGQLYALTATHTAGDLQVHALETPLEEIASRWNRVAPLMMRPESRLKRLQKRLADLWQRLIAPIAERLRTKKRLLILPYRDLFDIPFAGLYDARNKRYLIQEWTIQIAPSATVLAKVERETTEAVTIIMPLGTNRPLLVGYPGEPYLQGVEPEIERLSRLLPQADVLFGEAVTLPNIMKRLPNRPLIHIAGHIVYDQTAPLESGIPLAKARWLRASDLYLRYGYLNSSTVVLSGCESAGGRAKGGDMLGLTSAFLYAGATGIVASLWSVDDKATAKLMSSLYEKITQKIESAQALRHAQLTLLHDHATAHPYYWAAFVLNGASRVWG